MITAFAIRANPMETMVKEIIQAILLTLALTSVLAVAFVAVSMLVSASPIAVGLIAFAVVFCADMTPQKGSK